MKLLENGGGRLVFSLGAREKAFLERLVAFFPLDSSTEPKLSRTGGAELHDADQLLRESLAEQQDEMKAWLTERLAEGNALRKVKGGWQLAIQGDEADRLLRVFNELRVSAWHRLGCPEELDHEHLSNQATDAPYYVILMLAGQFQMVLLGALESGSSYPAAEE